MATNKFLELISDNSSEALKGRAENLAKLTQLEVNSFVSELEREKLLYQNKLNKLTDLAPNTTIDLKLSCGDDFDAKSWVKELHKIKMELRLLATKIEEARAIQEEWFEEDKK